MLSFSSCRAVVLYSVSKGRAWGCVTTTKSRSSQLMLQKVRLVWLLATCTHPGHKKNQSFSVVSVLAITQAAGLRLIAWISKHTVGQGWPEIEREEQDKGCDKDRDLPHGSFWIQLVLIPKLKNRGSEHDNSLIDGCLYLCIQPWKFTYHLLTCASLVSHCVLYSF